MGVQTIVSMFFVTRLKTIGLCPAISCAPTDLHVKELLALKEF